MRNTSTTSGVSTNTCGAMAWYPMACTQALPVRNVRTLLIIPGPKYWNHTNRSDKATSRGEIEAARAYGMSGLTLYRCIILPSALRRALPAYSNEVILMLHATTLAATATVPDLLKVARNASSDYYLPFVAYGIAAVLYLCISFALIWLFRRAERRWLAYLR